MRLKEVGLLGQDGLIRSDGLIDLAGIEIHGPEVGRHAGIIRFQRQVALIILDRCVVFLKVVVHIPQAAERIQITRYKLKQLTIGGQGRTAIAGIQL